ncbi:hypothetical protein BDP27DRAFT_1325838 [Rhodocollybia butyracea]|uniref:Angiogenic factor with G patch and FHA domains 1 n=1 Tax=Rhodocollybia butyracea TaxID=206335 RepID=A0A9P5U7X1_9AGAR|nr:hypothetical protein BDP27DRAFT_1325838 [Rhodocollybia butyracea]
MEDGEIPFNPFQAISSSQHRRKSHGPLENESYAHNPSYEWPWDNATPVLDDIWHTKNPGTLRSDSPETWLRLLVINSRALPPKARIAVIDEYPEVQLGRDNSTSGTVPRIRLKEMEVSKLHATVYWDQAWKIVDMGSKHGTYLRSTTGNSQAAETNLRLSIPKTASKPKQLHHLDQLTLGTTIFVVHIHENRLPCEECSPQTGEEIPLFADSKRKRSHLNVEVDLRSHIRDSKVALSQLKRDLMSRHSSNSDLVAGANQYVDRSARRRAMYRPSPFDAPGVSSASHLSSTNSAQSESSHLIPEPISQPAVPVPTSSIGHKLLVKQGWHPGTGLGLAGGGPVEPLQLKFSIDRSGLGSRR